MEKINKTEEEWKKELSPELYNIAREKGTESPFTGKYYFEKSEGIYKCAACGNSLFSSSAKFESGSGWPSFYEPISNDSVVMISDGGLSMSRTELICGRCGAHLGHVFDDGPKPTGKRFCINSISLDLEKNEQPAKEAG